MRNLSHSILPILLSALLVPAAAPAVASASASATQGAATQSRLGRGFSRRSPSFGSRSRGRTRYPGRSYRRPFSGRRFFGGVLKALGVAYLFHLMFGWGAGGSPFGLLLLAAIVLFFVTRRRRMRRPMYY
jgi:uncharacterized membrane protein